MATQVNPFKMVLGHFTSNQLWVFLSFFLLQVGFDLINPRVASYGVLLALQTSSFHELRGRRNSISSDSESDDAMPTFKDLLAADLRDIGWWAQRTWDQLRSFVAPIRLSSAEADHDLFANAHETQQSSGSSVNEMPEDLRAAMQTMTLEAEVALPQEGPLGLLAEHRDLLDPMPNVHNVAELRPVILRQSSRPTSSPLAAEILSDPVDDEDRTPSPTQNPSTTQERALNTSDPTAEDLISAAASTESSRPAHESEHSSRATSRAHSRSREDRVEISTITTPNGDTSLQFSIPINVDETDGERGFRVPSGTSVTDSDDASSTDSDEDFDSRIRLRDVPAETLVGMLSLRITQLILWPLEAILVRNIALGFGPAGAWKNDVIRPPFRPWLGWPIFFKQTQKTLLIWGMPVAIGLAIWQLEYQYVWWQGRRRHRWNSSK